MEEKQLQSNAAAQMLAQTQRGGLPNLAKALVAAFSEIPAGVVKDANNPHFGNDYATLEAVETLIKPILSKNKLAFIQTPGRIVGETIEITGMLIHESGEHLIFQTAMAVSKQRSKKGGDEDGGKLTAQAVGSAITYGRRYQLMAVFGLAPVDDDGEAASGSDYEPREPRRTRKVTQKEQDDAAEGTYARRKEALKEAIEKFEGTADELSDKFKAQVEEFADPDLNEAYVEKRRQLKAAAKGK
jgi:hypothetical protein